MARTVAIIVGAGRGHRFGGETPKQYLALAGRPVLAHTLDAFAAHPGVDAVLPVIHPDDREMFDEAAAGIVGVLAPAAGGATRQDSVLNGLEALAAEAPEFVLIHDAARPRASAGLIDRVLTALATFDGALPALAVTDTLKHAGADGRIDATVPRDGLWRAQTPQGFRFQPLLAAHRALAGQALTDDAAVAERHGLAVTVVAGDEENIKITTPEDMRRMAEIFSGGRTGGLRIGSGYDVHKLGPGDGVWLGGIKIPFEQGLVGHSDADVALHAITDAVFGAMADGDIGQHFPPSDEKWRGASSDRFLAYAVERLRARGGEIENVDLTIICERPKVGPHRDAIRARIAAIAGLDVSRISVKATTTEKLGFTGRGEGIAAEAVVLARLG